MMRSPPRNSVLAAPTTACQGSILSMSTSSSKPAGMPVTIIRREMPRSRTAMALTPVAISTSSWTVCGILAGSAWMSTMLTAAAVASRCCSHCMRKLATEVGKISSSEMRTKPTVRTRSLVDSRRRNGTLPEL
jgi:hypothetical protein